MNTHTTPQVSQTELARRLGISQPHLSQILSRKRRPSLTVAETIADWQGVHVLHVMAPERYDAAGQRITSHA
jgi:transcriptional regulator with XRE-family HTH domain